MKETEAMYTKSKIERAKTAHELIKNSGYPSMGELIKIVEDGNIFNLPGIIRADIKRAYDVYGAPAEYVRGKLTHKKVSRARMDPALQEPSKSVEIHGDVMHIDGEMFLITVSGFCPNQIVS